MKRFLLLLVMVAPFLMGATAERHLAPYNSALDTAHQTELLWWYRPVPVDGMNECLPPMFMTPGTTKGCGVSYQSEVFPAFDVHITNVKFIVGLAGDQSPAQYLCTFQFINFTGSHDSIPGAEMMVIPAGSVVDTVIDFETDFTMDQNERIGLREKDCTDLYDEAATPQTTGNPDGLCDADLTTQFCTGVIDPYFLVYVYGHWN
jgi:hypothetical protein